MLHDVEEQAALTSTLSSFYHFHKWQYEQVVAPRKAKYASLSSENQALLPWFPKYIADLEQCVDMNRLFTQELAVAVAGEWGCLSNFTKWLPASSGDFDKVKATLLQLAREWSQEGRAERRVAFLRIVNELTRRFPNRVERQNVKVLVPGCGLGRLVWELVGQGFSCQGNEFSYHMLLASTFVLNESPSPFCHFIFPYLCSSLHVESRDLQLRSVPIPDADPHTIHTLAKENPSIPYSDLMSMAAGPFVDLYGPSSNSKDAPSDVAEFRVTSQGSFDVVCTCFFLDTAPDIIQYLQTVQFCTKPDGIWINFGPLLWHFQDDAAEGGLELARDDLINLIKQIGFKFTETTHAIESTYTADDHCLGRFQYDCEFWVCEK